MTCPRCGKESPASWILCKDCAPDPASSKTKKSAKTRRIPENLQRPKPKRHMFRYIIIAIAIILAIYFQFGFYTIPPTDSIPEGATLIVWRYGDISQPFINSPDAAMSKISAQENILLPDFVPTNRTIMQLPYIEFLYLQSPTGDRQEN